MSDAFLGRLALLLAMSAGLCRPAFGQEPAPASASTEPAWSGSVSAAWYFLPEESDYIQPTFKADRNWLHLETRYAYEDRKSLSFFGGVNFEFGKDVKLAVTPMIGGLVGDVDGIIPAAEVDFTVWRFEAYGEAEYVFDLNDSDSKFFYMWSELSVRPTEWLRAGLVTQRTRVYRTERDIQRGPLVGVSFSKIDATFYWFNPGADDHLAVLSIGVSF
jgi:hypothetical protein